MTEAEITLKYREFPVTLTYWALIGCVPFVTLFTLMCSIQAWSMKNGQASNISIFVFSLVLLTLGVILGLLITSDKTVFLTRDGISLPFALCQRLGLRSQHAWSDVSAIKLLPRGKKGVLQINFRDSSSARLKLDLLPEKELENLIVSMDVWAGGSEHFPALLEARVRLSEDKGDVAHLGYTELWEEELTRRFGPTNFIPLEAGHIVRSFTVQRQLAFGGLSAIYLVTNPEKERFVLKEAVVPGDADDSIRQAAEQMLDREARILASLSHPNIAKVFDHFLEDGRHYILMELIDGEDLRRLVHEHGLQPEADVIDWSIQLLKILEYLHAQVPPIIHRDLSPDNLMLTHDGNLVVIDFGAANHFVGTATGTMIGKQSYIAPEQLRGKAEPASDIYAFGGTVFFLLTGEDPEPLAVSHPRTVKSFISNDIDQVVARCTEQEPEDRPSDMPRLIAQLQSIAGKVAR